MTQVVIINNMVAGGPSLPSRKRLYAMPYEDALSAIAGVIECLRSIDGAAGLMVDRRLEAAKVRYREMEIGHPGKFAAPAALNEQPS